MNVTYRPKDGKDEELLAVVRTHRQILRDQQLITERPAHVLCESDSSIVDVFEWRSAARARTHSTPAIQPSWEKFDAIGEYVPLSNLPETGEMFAEFDAVEL